MASDEMRPKGPLSSVEPGPDALGDLKLTDGLPDMLSAASRLISA